MAFTLCNQFSHHKDKFKPIRCLFLLKLASCWEVSWPKVDTMNESIKDKKPCGFTFVITFYNLIFGLCSFQHIDHFKADMNTLFWYSYVASDCRVSPAHIMWLLTHRVSVFISSTPRFHSDWLLTRLVITAAQKLCKKITSGQHHRISCERRRVTWLF